MKTIWFALLLILMGIVGFVIGVLAMQNNVLLTTALYVRNCQYTNQITELANKQADLLELYNPDNIYPRLKYIEC